MKKVLQRLWSDEAGFIVSAELVLIATITVIGLIVGLVHIRDSVVGELADIAEAIGRTDQTYQYDGLASAHATVDGARFTDVADLCDQLGAPPVGGFSGGITVYTARLNEGT